MVLIINTSKKQAQSVSDIFYYMGIISCFATPKEAFSEISDLYRAVIVLNPESFPDIEDFVTKIKSYASSVPIFAIIYMLIKLYIERRLRNKELPSATEDYYSEHEKREFIEKDDNKHSFAARIRNTTNQIAKKTLGGKLKNVLNKKEKNASDADKTDKDS